MYVSPRTARQTEGYTLRNQGSTRVLLKELRSYPDTFASEEPLFVKKRFFVRLKITFRVLFIQRGKTSSSIVEILEKLFCQGLFVLYRKSSR